MPHVGRDEINVNCYNVIFNSIHSNPPNIANTIVMTIKYYTYKCRCGDKKPSIYEFRSQIYMIRNIEKYNAIVNNTIDKHNRKWFGIIDHDVGVNNVIADNYISEYVQSM